MNEIKVGLFDDHPMVANGLESFLTSQKIEVVFSCDNKPSLISNLRNSKVDILILDIVAPDIKGLELFEIISKNFPQIKIIAHSSLMSIMLVENLLSLGVKGYINKRQPPDDFIDCIKNVVDNEISVPKEYHFLISKYRTFTTNLLSSREIEIVELISKEFTSIEIAEKLFISPYTVENHRKTIFRKLEVKNLAGMIVAATKIGYIS
jgi:DNA-binding NarL/FixJ family response regulator